MRSYLVELVVAAFAVLLIGRVSGVSLVDHFSQDSWWDPLCVACGLVEGFQVSEPCVEAY